MQKLLFRLTLLLFFASSCSNELDVTAEWKEFPVTYAILDAQAGAQYFRIEKAFLDEEVSALVIAKNPDSIYYPETAITATLEQVAPNGNVLKTYPLKRVNGNDEGFPRKPGTFATDPNWLYKANTSGNDTLAAGQQYRLRIKRSNGGPDITGATTVPNDFQFIPEMFVDGTPNSKKIMCDTSGIFEPGWRADGNAVYFNLTYTIRYRDVNPMTGETINTHSLLWEVFKDEPGEPSNSVQGVYTKKYREVTPSIFDFLNQNIPAAETACGGCIRFFDPFELTLEGGGRELEKLKQSLSANSGITGAEIVNLYTNLSEGYGLVTSKNKLIFPQLRLDQEGIRLVEKNYKTKHLNFKVQ